MGNRSGHNSDGDLYEHFPEGELSNKPHKSRPSSLENSENTSTSSSPLNLKGSFDHIRGRSQSFSSEDTVLSRDTPSSPRDGLFSPTSSAVAGCSTKLNASLTRNGFSSYDILQKGIQTQPQSVRHRSASPGSEMVTLEEFLEESNRLSPPNETSARDDLVSDYFRKANEHPSVGHQFSQATRKETTRTPTSYVTPTVKVPGTEDDGRPAKPGHYVKPNLRSTDSETVANPTGSYKLPYNQPGKASRQTTQAQQCGTASRQSISLNRAFSLASADLLRATGPEVYRRYDSLPKPGTVDTQLRRDSSSQPSHLSLAAGSQVPLRERPQSAKVASSLPSVDACCRQLDVRRLSLAPPKDERSLSLPPFPHSPAALKDDVNTQPQERAKAGVEQPFCPPQYATSKAKAKPTSQPGEVATVTPVRVVSSSLEGSTPQPQTSSDTSFAKCQSRSTENDSVAGGTEDTNRGVSSKNPSASPEPPGDQQTVWYEYGCV